MCRLEECFFLSIMRTCGLIRQQIINGKTSIYAEKDKWNAFLSQYEVCDVEMSTSKFSAVLDNENTRKNMTFIRIGTKSSSSYLRATTQYNHHILPPITKMRQLSYNFLNSMSADILKIIHWYVNKSVSVPAIYKRCPSNSSKSTYISTSSSTSTSHDNPPILQSLCPILNSLNINTSALENKQLVVIY